MLLVEQNARAALETADYGYVLESGEVVHQGRASDLMRDPRVMATYLGKSAQSVSGCGIQTDHASERQEQE